MGFLRLPVPTLVSTAFCFVATQEKRAGRAELTSCSPPAKHEANWPDRYASYTAAEQSGAELPQ